MAFGGENYVLAVVDLGDNGLELLLNGGVQLIGGMVVVGLLTQADHFLGQGTAALAPLGPHLGEGHVDPQFLALWPR